MPERRPRGGGFEGGAGGFFGHNYTMRDANVAYDRRRTLGRPEAVGGIAGTGYIPSEEFSFIDLGSRIKLAWDFSHHHKGLSRIGSFIGNFQVLTHNVSRQARLAQMEIQLGKRHTAKEIDDQTYGQRIMYEADRYYGWLRNKTVISEEEYRSHMTAFAEKHGIEYVFDDEPVRTR